MNIAMTQRGVAVAQPLKEMVSLVTGSTSGIRLGIARALAAAGSAVVLNGFGKPEEIKVPSRPSGRISAFWLPIPPPICRIPTLSPR